MAHEFKIMNQSGTITTYTSYDDIPNNSTLKHVISFKPDLGTEIDSNEILLESETLDSGETDKFIEDTSTGANLVLNGVKSSLVYANGLLTVAVAVATPTVDEAPAPTAVIVTNPYKYGCAECIILTRSFF